VISADGSRLATRSSLGGAIRIWDIATGKHIRDFENLKTPDPHAALSPDGKVLVVGGTGLTARLLDTATGKELRVLPLEGKRPWSFVFSPDGQTLAMITDVPPSYGERQIVLWDLASGGDKPRVLMPLRGMAWIEQFSADGKTLVLRSSDNCMLLDVATGKDRPAWDAHRGGTGSVTD